MWKLGFIIVVLVGAFIVWQELKIFRSKETVRVKKLKDLTAGKEELADENLRADTLDVTAETSVRRAQNDAFEDEINKIGE